MRLLRILAVVAALWAAPGAHAQAQAPGLSPEPDAASELEGELKTARFRIRYTPRARGAAQALAREIESTRDGFARVLGRDWEGITEVRIGVGREELERIALPGGRPPGWAMALAYPEQNVILLEALSLIEPKNGATVRHELAHVALGRLGKGWPRWFQEGMAQRLTGEGNGVTQYAAMFRALHGSRLIPLEDLAEGWPERPEDVEIAYAQSASFVGHLLEVHGSATLGELIDLVKAGAPFETAFARAFHTSLRLEEESWLATLPGRYSWLPIVTTGTTLWAVAAGLCVGAWVRRRRSKRLRLLEMKAEEAAEDAAAQLAKAEAQRAKADAVAAHLEALQDVTPALQDFTEEELEETQPPSGKPTVH